MGGKMHVTAALSLLCRNVPKDSVLHLGAEMGSILPDGNGTLGIDGDCCFSLKTRLILKQNKMLA